MYSQSDSQNAQARVLANAGVDAGAGHKVLRDTYRLLSATLLFSAVVAGTSAALKLPAPGLILTLAGYFGLLFLTFRLRNSAWGLASVFALTGFMGYTLGPMIGHYLSMSGGPQLVATSMGVTGAIFLGLSWYARSTRAVNTANWGSFLIIGILTAFGLGLAAIFFEIPALSLTVSAAFVLLKELYATPALVGDTLADHWQLTLGLTIIAFVALLPKGLIGLSSLPQRWKGRA